jgi:hypothetical protein
MILIFLFILVIICFFSKSKIENFKIKKKNDIMNLHKSNEYIIYKIKKNKPFLISRCASEADVAYKYVKNKKIINPKNLSNNAGIYSKSDKDVKIYAQKYNECIKNSDCMACFPNLFNMFQNYFCDLYNLPKINNRTIEPFYLLSENIKPWSNYLSNKTVLIVNPFTESMKTQLNNNFQIFRDKNKKIFEDQQNIKFYKSFNTSAGNHIHYNWIETFNIMKNDIKKINFDIALLGCGGYGLPLCNFIFKDLNKSAIYVGGGLQLYFGIMGKRWKETDYWKKIIQEENPKFISPSGDEILKNNTKVEGGCYW